MVCPRPPDLVDKRRRTTEQERAEIREFLHKGYRISSVSAALTESAWVRSLRRRGHNSNQPPTPGGEVSLQLGDTAQTSRRKRPRAGSPATISDRGAALMSPADAPCAARPPCARSAKRPKSTPIRGPLGHKRLAGAHLQFVGGDRGFRAFCTLWSFGERAEPEPYVRIVTSRGNRRQEKGFSEYERSWP
jgi:hypothetical protein